MTALMWTFAKLARAFLQFQPAFFCRQKRLESLSGYVICVYHSTNGKRS